MPDKWDEIAARLYTEFDADIAQALRDAERAGMERAVEVCKTLLPNAGDDEFGGGWTRAIEYAIDAIRAAKETNKEENT